jgi:Ca2+-binding EF-hand superfamily protein
MRKFLLAAALAGTAIGGVAIAGQAGPGAGGGMMRADTDGDGKISRQEFLAQADARFARLDTNGDGVITADEFAARREANRERRGGFGQRADGDIPPSSVPPQGGSAFDRLDTNHDGKVTRDEYRAEANARFDRLDTNHDGFIDQNEMAAMRHGGGGMGGGGMGGPGGMPPSGPAAAGEGDPAKHHHKSLIERADTNHDGRVSREEYRALADARFDKIDTNHDGFIDQAEIDVAREKMKQHFRHRHDNQQGAPGAMPPPGPGAPSPDTGQ